MKWWKDAWGTWIPLFHSIFRLERLEKGDWVGKKKETKKQRVKLQYANEQNQRVFLFAKSQKEPLSWRDSLWEEWRIGVVVEWMNSNGESGVRDPVQTLFFFNKKGCGCPTLSRVSFVELPIIIIDFTNSSQCLD